MTDVSSVWLFCWISNMMANIPQIAFHGSPSTGEVPFWRPPMFQGWTSEHLEVNWFHLPVRHFSHPAIHLGCPCLLVTSPATVFPEMSLWPELEGASNKEYPVRQSIWIPVRPSALPNRRAEMGIRAGLRGLVIIYRHAYAHCAHTRARKHTKHSECESPVARWSVFSFHLSKQALVSHSTAEAGC